MQISPKLVTNADAANQRLSRDRIGRLEDGKEPVVVKVEQNPSALERKRAALVWLAQTQPGLAPTPIAFGDAILGPERVTCLVTNRCRGSSPTTVAGWRRMGGMVARLADLGYPEHILPSLYPDQFIQAHRERISELGSRLDLVAASVPDWTELGHRTLPGTTALTLTHGDPGPGNYLDTGWSGRLIDWEEAHVAPLGLDLARLMFIALLGSGPAGYVARDHRARAAAVTAGYLSAIQHRWLPTSDELRWWLSVAGIQFIHRRWHLGGPAPWQQAAAVLASALMSDRARN